MFVINYKYNILFSSELFSGIDSLNEGGYKLFRYVGTYLLMYDVENKNDLLKHMITKTKDFLNNIRNNFFFI